MATTDLLSVVRTAERRLILAAHQEWLDRSERELGARLADIFGRQRREFLRRLERLRTSFRENVGDRTDVMWWEVAALTEVSLVLLVERELRAGFARGATETRAVFGLQADAFDLQDPRAIEFASRHAADLVTGINETTRAEMRRIITAGVEEGLAYNRVARMIADATGFSLDRAQMIAVHEAGLSYAAGQKHVNDELAAAGIALVAEWIDVGDERVCPICSGNASQGAIPYGDSFQSGDQYAPAHPRCRCAVAVEPAVTASV